MSLRIPVAASCSQDNILAQQDQVQLRREVEREPTEEVPKLLEEELPQAEELLQVGELQQEGELQRVVLDPSVEERALVKVAVLCFSQAVL